MPRRKSAYQYVSGPKRKRRENSHHKELQRIKTRLIEITMVIENYIYNKVPVSPSQAELYIREVNQYRTECSKDERSLQVIEKLTRCMKAIIVERQEQGHVPPSYLTGYNQGDVDDRRSNASSPVYSLPDEDRTQLTQTFTDTNSYIKITQAKNKTKIHAIQEPNDYNKHIYRTHAVDNASPNMSDNKVVEIIEDNNINVNKITTITTADVNMYNALSNLSIRDVEAQDKMMESETEYSQSILNNYEDVINKMQQDYTNVDFSDRQDKDKENIDKRLEKRPTQLNKNTPVVLADVSKTANPVALDSNNQLITTSTIYNLNHPLVAKVSKAINRTITNSKKQLISDKNDHTKANNNLSIQQTRTPFQNKINIIDKTGDPNKDPKVTPKIIKSLKGKSQKKERGVSQVTVKNKRGPRKKKLDVRNIKDNGKLSIEYLPRSNANENKPVDTAPKRKYTRKNTHKNTISKDFSIPIYNKNVVNDLSWLENIRYVREIAEDEYDRQLTDLHESFWDNYLLPPNFDDKDFLY